MAAIPASLKEPPTPASKVERLPPSMPDFGRAVPCWSVGSLAAEDRHCAESRRYGMRLATFMETSNGKPVGNQGSR